MTNARDIMDAELKAKVIPTLRHAGFKGSFPHFRRLGEAGVDLITFQFDRHGGGFFLEIACASKQGFTTHWGKHIPAAKVTAWDLHPNQRYRIQPHQGESREAWFRFDDGQVQKAAQQVLNELPRAESWWREAQQRTPAEYPTRRAD